MTTSAQKTSTDFPGKLREALKSCPASGRYLIGVSGGRDSMALLHGLHLLGYRHIAVCHLNHGLRGAAAGADARLVQRQAKKFGFAFESLRVDTRQTATWEKKSLEHAARDLRYSFFASCAKKHRCRRLFLAHHADDQEETILHNFLRGSGAAGLAGMQEISRRNGLTLIRPLLKIMREEIARFVNEQSIPFREDASNADPSHTRNRLRHEILPAIRRVMGPASRDAVLRAAEILHEENAWMESLLPPFEKKLSCKALRTMPLGMQRRMVWRWLQKLGVPFAGFAETTRVLTLLNDGTGPARASLPGDMTARRRSGTIFLERKRK